MGMLLMRSPLTMIKQSIDNDIVDAEEENGIERRYKEKSGNLIDVTDIDDTCNISEVPEEISGNLIDVTTDIDETYNTSEVPQIMDTKNVRIENEEGNVVEDEKVDTNTKKSKEMGEKINKEKEKN